MDQNRFFIIDFDSTLVKVESLDLLAEIVLEHHADKSKIVAQIKEITQLGMDGKLSFSESLEKRIKLFRPSKNDVELLVEELRSQVSDSVLRNLEFFKQNSDQIYVVSGGFHEFITPVVAELGIADSHVLANRFVWNGDVAIGFDADNPLSKKGGKVMAVKELCLNGQIVVIGDGYTDYEIRKEETADLFIAFCENVRRENVTVHADIIAENFDQIIIELENII